jgi:hypothetical protein
MAVVRDEVVLLPLVPVTPIIFPGHSAKNIFVADVRWVAVPRCGEISCIRTPGDRITVSKAAVPLR